MQFIEFSLKDSSAVDRLQKLFLYIKKLKSKNQDCQVPDLDIMIYDHLDEFYTKEELEYFWWPTEKEAQEFWRKYNALPESEREKHLHSVPWDLETVFSEIGAGEYCIIGCTVVGDGIYRLNFESPGYPYGGTAPMQEALKAYGASIIKVEE